MFRHSISAWHTLCAIVCAALVVMSFGIGGIGAVAAVHTAGNTFFVAPAPGGSDANPCSQGAPCATFARTIGVAQAGDTISVAAGTYNEANIQVRKNLTITGASAAQTVVNGGGQSRVFTIYESLSSVAINALTITGGSANGTTRGYSNGGGGGMFVGYQTNLALTNVAVKGNRESGGVGGGGIYNFVGTLSLTGCTIDGNGASNFGGGIANDGGTITLESSAVTNNNLSGAGGEPDGGGIINLGPNLTVNNSTIANNGGARYGGGIANITNSATAITNSMITGNAAMAAGGGLFNDGDDNGAFPTKMTVQGSTISGNQVGASGNGGGIDNLSILSIQGSAITGNAAGNGGGGILSEGTMTLANSTVSGNNAKASPGGGINFEGGIGAGVGTVTNSTIASNTAPGPGAGILVAASGVLSMTNTTIANNTDNGPSGSFLVGAGAFVTGGTLNLAFSTVAGNTAVHGSGLYLQSGAINLAGTLIAGNAGENCGGNAAGSQGFNMASDGSCSGVPSAGIAVGALADNGGPTQTLALPAGSPAIDKGGTAANGCPSTDQRGFTRPVGAACDIGAFEFGGSVAATLTADRTTVPFGQNSVTLTFNTGSGAPGLVCVAANGGAEAAFAGGPSGSVAFPFINSGAYRFILHPGSACTGAQLATVTVTKQNPKGQTGPAVVATPATLSFATSTQTLTRSSTVSFDSGDGAVVQVMLAVNGSTPQLYAAAQYGTVTAPWIFSGTYTFTLVKGGQVVDTATVQTTAQISSPTGTTSGGPSPNVTTTNGTAVLLTFDTGTGQPAALCTNFGGLASFSANGAGYASVNNTGTVTYDLHIGTCAGAKATPGTVTITSS